MLDIGIESHPVLVYSDQYVVLEPVDIVMSGFGGSIEWVVGRCDLGIIMGLCVLFLFGFKFAAVKTIGLPFLSFP